MHSNGGRSGRGGGRAPSSGRGGMAGRGSGLWSGRATQTNRLPDDGIRMIKRAEDLIEAEEQLLAWCSKEYSELRHIFIDGTVVFPRMPTDDDINNELTLMGQGPRRLPVPEGEPEGTVGELVHVVSEDVRNMMKREKVKDATAGVKLIEKNLPAVYQKIWSKCSPTLQEKMKMHDRFPRIRMLEAAPALWLLVKEIASTGVYADQMTRIKEIRERFTEFHMYPNEDLEKYKKRFEQMAAVLEDYGLAYGEDELVHAFINKLDARYETLKEVIGNTGMYVGALYRGEPPATIDEAYAAAQNALMQGLKSAARNRYAAASSVNQGAMFGAQANYGSGRGGRGDGGRGRGAGRGGGRGGVATARGGAATASDQSAKKTTDANTNEVVCRTCGGGGHVMKNCPSNGRWHIDCFNCGGKGHMSFDCPSEAKKVGMMLGTVCSLAMKSDKDMMLGVNDIALDNCTDVSIFCNRELLTNVTRGPRWQITGHKADVSIYTNLCGKYGIMDVVYAKDAAANVLCQSDVAEIYPLYEVEKGVRAITEQGPLDFVKKGKKFILDTFNPVVWSHVEFKAMWENRLNKEYEFNALGSDMVANTYVGRMRNPRTLGQNVIETVKGNEAMYTIQEKNAAKEAADFIRRSGYQSPANLVEMAKAGGFSGNVPTAHDFQRAIEIYGKPLSYFKGKMHDHKEPAVKAEYTPPLTRENQVANVDIANFEGMSVLVALMDPLNMSICSVIKNHQPAELIRALTDISKVLATRNLKMSTVIHDRERGFTAAKDSIPGVVFEPVAPGAHVPKAE